MLERMKEIFERIEEINQTFKGISPRRARREKGDFAAAMKSLAQTPATGKILQNKKETAITPVAIPSPASKPNLQFSDLIQKYSSMYNLDPNLVRRIIEVESNFDPSSVSKKGAIGLMQLMPETARELGITNPFDPEENISGGTKYLAMLLAQNAGNLSRALASYNAGPGAVRQHGGIPPFPETKNFVKKVLDGISKKAENSEE